MHLFRTEITIFARGSDLNSYFGTTPKDEISVELGNRLYRVARSADEEFDRIKIGDTLNVLANSNGNIVNVIRPTQEQTFEALKNDGKEKITSPIQGGCWPVEPWY